MTLIIRQPFNQKKYLSEAVPTPTLFELLAANKKQINAFEKARLSTNKSVQAQLEFIKKGSFCEVLIPDETKRENARLANRNLDAKSNVLLSNPELLASVNREKARIISVREQVVEIYDTLVTRLGKGTDCTLDRLTSDAINDPEAFARIYAQCSKKSVTSTVPSSESSVAASVPTESITPVARDNRNLLKKGLDGIRNWWSGGGESDYEYDEVEETNESIGVAPADEASVTVAATASIPTSRYDEAAKFYLEEVAALELKARDINATKKVGSLKDQILQAINQEIERSTGELSTSGVADTEVALRLLEQKKRNSIREVDIAFGGMNRIMSRQQKQLEDLNEDIHNLSLTGSIEELTAKQEELDNLTASITKDQLSKQDIQDALRLELLRKYGIKVPKA